MIKKVHPSILASFTPSQLNALAAVSKPSPGQHWIDYRVSLPIFGRRIYLTILAGRERRSLTRLKHEGQISLAITSISYVVTTWMIASALIVSLVTVLYILKTIIGLDLIEGPSFMHDFVYP